MFPNLIFLSQFLYSKPQKWILGVTLLLSLLKRLIKALSEKKKER